MSALNLEADISEQIAPLDETRWTKLQTEICMNVANARFYAFAAEADRMAELVRLCVIQRLLAANYLHVCADYNGLYFDYGRDRIQAVMAEALEAAA